MREVPAIVTAKVRCQSPVNRGRSTQPVFPGFRAPGDSPEMDIGGFRPVDVAGPEEPDVPVCEGVAARNAFEGHLHDIAVEQLVSHAAFQSPCRRRRLMKFRGVRIDRAQLDRGATRFVQDIPRPHGTIVDVLEVQARVGRHKQGTRLLRMRQGRHAVVAGLVPRQHGVVHGAVIHNDRGEISAVEHDVRDVGSGARRAPDETRCKGKDNPQRRPHLETSDRFPRHV